MATKEFKLDEVLQELRTLYKKHDISIVQLAELVSSGDTTSHVAVTQRALNESNPSLGGATPASFEADLAHFKELFAKLRFSYVEQVTKEKFIRAIVGDPPLIVTPQENAELERENLEAKATLKSRKVEVANMVGDLEIRGRNLAQRLEKTRLETEELEGLPAKIFSLEEEISQLKEVQGSNKGPSMVLPLSRTLELVDERTKERDELSRQIEQLQTLGSRKTNELERLQSELIPLETKRQNSAAAAKEARRRKEAALGGVQDDLEERGRWWRASELALEKMLDIQKS